MSLCNRESATAIANVIAIGTDLKGLALWNTSNSPGVEWVAWKLLVQVDGMY